MYISYYIPHYNMSNHVYTFDFFEFVFPAIPNANFTLGNLVISVNRILSFVNDDFFDDIPNLHKYVIEEKQIKLHESSQLVIVSNSGNTLIIKNMNTSRYLKNFCTNDLFKQAFKNTFLQLTSESADCFLEENCAVTSVDFANFLHHMNHNIKVYSEQNNMADNTYNTHQLYVNMRAKLFESTDCMNHIFSYIDFPNLCEMRLVCTKFAYIIKGCTLPPYLIDTMNDIKTEFSYGCFHDAKSGNIVDKYIDYMERMHENMEMDAQLVKYVNEYILLKCLIKFGSAIPNKLTKHLHIAYISQKENRDKNDEIDMHNLKLKLMLTEEQFIRDNFSNMSIIMYYLKNKMVHDLYSLINMKCIRPSSHSINKIGHYILTKYGHQAFLELYMKNCWKCFPDLNYRTYPCYQQMVNYLNAMMSRNIMVSYSVKIYFLDIVQIDDINNCSKTTAKEFVDEALYRDNVSVFSKIFETKKIRKSRKTYIKYAKELKANCPKIIEYLKNSK